MRLVIILSSFVLLPSLTVAQQLRGDIERHILDNNKEIVLELWQALKIPAVAKDAVNIRKKANFLRERLQARDFKAELLETSGNPLVYGERKIAGATRTILVYCHYDGQPVDASKWDQANPFLPVLRDGKLNEGGQVIDFDVQDKFRSDWRIYARSSSDDTAPIIAMLATLDALDSLGVSPSSNLRVVLDGEEEAGSPNLVPAIERYRKKLEADLMLIFDGPLHQSNLPTLTYGARGILTLSLTIYGPKFPLHSGHYGNWAPNPAMRLAQLLASMKDEGGRVVIDGFYDNIKLTDEDYDVLASVPDDLPELMSNLGFSEPERVGRSLQEAIQFPSLNVRGLESAWVGGEARTIVPAEATAAIDVRLVRETPAETMYNKILEHIEEQGYQIIREVPDDESRASYGRLARVTRFAGSNAYRTPINNEEAVRVYETIAEMWGSPPVRKRTSGGTVPIAPFVRALGLPALNVPTVNFDNNQHSPNENIRIGHFLNSILTFAAIFTM